MHPTVQFAHQVQFLEGEVLVVSVLSEAYILSYYGVSDLELMSLV